MDSTDGRLVAKLQADVKSEQLPSNGFPFKKEDSQGGISAKDETTTIVKKYNNDLK